MLKLYDNLDIAIEEYNNRKRHIDTNLKYFANDILEIMDIENSDEIKFCFERAFQVFESLDLPLYENFKRVYRFNGETLIMDWKISPLACYLIIINCKPSYERVARTQLFFANKERAVLIKVSGRNENSHY